MFRKLISESNGNFLVTEDRFKEFYLLEYFTTATFFLLVLTQRTPCAMYAYFAVLKSLFQFYDIEMRAKNFYFILLRAFLRQYQIILLRLIRRVARLFIIIKQKKNLFLNELPLFYTSPGLHEMSWISREFARGRKENKTQHARSLPPSPLNSPRVTHLRSETAAGCLKVISAVT